MQQHQQQQPQQQQQQQEQQQEQDWDSLLGVVLVTAEQEAEVQSAGAAAGKQGSTARTLHRVSRKQLGAARSRIRHLNLARYERGRALAAGIAASATEAAPSAALAAAAAAPPVPWDLLAATPSLTSLDIVASQAQHLAAGGPAAAAAAAPSDVLAATLGRLRCPCVTDIQDSSQLAHLGRLLGPATGVTQLVLRTAEKPHEITPASLLGGLDAAQAGASAASAAAGDAEPAAAATACSWLPALRHLELPGQLLGLLETWVQHPKAASQLTALHLTCGAHLDADMDCLTACVGLRQLVMHGASQGTSVELPAELAQLTALSKFELSAGRLQEVPGAVLGLAQLRHLSLRENPGISCIPEEISRLCQLQQLDISRTGVEVLPEELGTWLPQLEGLDVNSNFVSTVPRSLTGLTRLRVSRCCFQHISSLTHLVRLRHFDMGHNNLQQPFQDLSRLSAMQTLCLGWYDRLSTQQMGEPGPMAALRSLTLSGNGPEPLQRLPGLMGAQQLTYLNLHHCVDPEQLSALGQLPQLRKLVIARRRPGETPWGAALPWLQQQPQLTSLGIIKCRVEGGELEQLPAGLEELDLSWCQLVEGQPGALTQLSRLCSLSLAFTIIKQLPSWLPSLQHVEELDVTACRIGPDDWEVLGKLPLLRQLVAPKEAEASILQHLPHLCWK